MKIPALLNFKGNPKFVTDGCSGYMTYLWNLVFHKDPPWNWCCVRHDWYYWSGGVTFQCPDEWAPGPGFGTRAQADAFLFDCIYKRGYRVWAWLCWLGVRAGGSQYLPFAWRWRYRDPYFTVLKELLPWFH
jgi:hypothetical protein